MVPVLPSELLNYISQFALWNDMNWYDIERWQIFALMSLCQQRRRYGRAERIDLAPRTDMPNEFLLQLRSPLTFRVLEEKLAARIPDRECYRSALHVVAIRTFNVGAYRRYFEVYAPSTDARHRSLARVCSLGLCHHNNLSYPNQLRRLESCAFNKEHSDWSNEIADIAESQSSAELRQLLQFYERMTADSPHCKAEEGEFDKILEFYFWSCIMDRKFDNAALLEKARTRLRYRRHSDPAAAAAALSMVEW